MKKIFSVLAVLTLFAGVFAGHPAATDNVSFDARIDTTITTLDTVVSTTDSQTIVSSYVLDPDKGWNYYLVNKTITGTNAANAELVIMVRAYDEGGTQRSMWTVDTVAGASSQAIKIPFFYQIMGSKYTIRAVAGGANGSQVITNGWQLIRYRPMNYNK